MVSLSVAVLFAVFGSLTPAGTLTLAVFEISGERVRHFSGDSLSICLAHVGLSSREMHANLKPRAGLRGIFLRSLCNYCVRCHRRCATHDEAGYTETTSRDSNFWVLIHVWDASFSHLQTDPRDRAAGNRAFRKPSSFLSLGRSRFRLRC